MLLDNFWVLNVGVVDLLVLDWGRDFRHQSALFW